MGRKQFNGKITLLKRTSGKDADYTPNETFTSRNVYANIDRITNNNKFDADQDNIGLNKTFLIRKKAYQDEEYFIYKNQTYVIETGDSEFIDYIILIGSKKINPVKIV